MRAKYSSYRETLLHLHSSALLSPEYLYRHNGPSRELPEYIVRSTTERGTTTAGRAPRHTLPAAAIATATFNPNKPDTPAQSNYVFTFCRSVQFAREIDLEKKKRKEGRNQKENVSGHR